MRITGFDVFDENGDALDADTHGNPLWQDSCHC